MLLSKLKKSHFTSSILHALPSRRMVNAYRNTIEFCGTAVGSNSNSTDLMVYHSKVYIVHSFNVKSIKRLATRMYLPIL